MSAENNEGRLTGHRRDEDELREVTERLNELTYRLEPQPDFHGTDEELKMMQTLERYYIDGYPKVSDEMWDRLKHQYNYQESLTSVAPSGRTWVRLQSPLPSINKAQSFEEFQRFCEQWPKGSKWLLEPKLDGLTANLVYEYDEMNGMYVLQFVTSRGNGRYGLKLWDHALDGMKTNGIPHAVEAIHVKEICGGLPEIFEIRGEALLQKNQKNLEKYGTADKERSAHGQNGPSMETVVWRSVVSGIFNRKVPSNVPGLLQYCFEKPANALWDDMSKPVERYGLEPQQQYGMSQFDGNALHVTDLSYARLFYSLTEDSRRFLRGCELYVLKRVDGTWSLYVRYVNGECLLWNDPGEEIYVVSYSASVNGVNLDTNALKSIPGLLYVDDVHLLDGKSHTVGERTPFCLETDDIHEIFQKVYEFYGCDENGKRDYSKPRYRNMHEFSIDGLVVKLKDSTESTQGMSIRKSISGGSRLVVPKYPSDQIALKLLSEPVRVKLERIEYNQTKLGNVTCQGVLDHPYRTESGAFVDRINLHNPEWLALNDWIHEGGEYDMIMALDIIPELLPPERWLKDGGEPGRR